jgi:hypothetical protein
MIKVKKQNKKTNVWRKRMSLEKLKMRVGSPKG